MSSMELAKIPCPPMQDRIFGPTPFELAYPDNSGRAETAVAGHRKSLGAKRGEKQQP